ncbi:hypothetical protein ACTFIR_003973 [Dictyostelium discoideum]
MLLRLIEYGSLNGKKLASDRFQTDVAIKLRSQTDITQCRKAITDLVSDKSSKRRPSDSASNTGEKFPMKKNHAGTNHNSNSRNSFDAQAENIRAAILPGLKSDLRVDLRKIRKHSYTIISTKSNFEIQYGTTTAHLIYSPPDIALFPYSSIFGIDCTNSTCSYFVI